MQNSRGNTKYRGGNFYLIENTSTKRKENIRRHFKFRGISPLFAILKAEPGAINTGDKNLERECIIAALQKEVNEQKTAICTLVDIISASDEELYNRYKYQKWSNINPIVRKYLRNRFNISNYCASFNIVRPTGIGMVAYENECIGQTFERYNKKVVSPKTVADLTQPQLSEMIESMIETLNKKKEEENAKCCSCE